MTLTRLIDKLYVFALLCVCAFIYAGWIWLSNQPDYFDQHWISFAKFHSAGRIIMSPERQRLYDPLFQRERLTAYVSSPSILSPLEVVDGRTEFPVGFVEHPPHFWMMYAPFSLFPPLTALRIFTAVTTAFGAAALFFLTRAAKTLNTPQTFALLIGAAACFPNRFALMLGQPAWILFALYATYIGAYLLKSERFAGVILALSTVKPQYPMFLALPAFFARRWKLIAWAAGVGAVLLGVCIATVGWHNIASYMPMVSRMNGQPAFSGDDIGMPCLRGLVSNFFGIPAGIKVGYVSGLVSLLLVSFVWWQTEKKQLAPHWAFSVSIFSILLFSPHLFRYDCLLLAIPAALTLPSLSLFDTSAPFADGGRHKAFLFWRYAFLTFPITSYIVERLAYPSTAAVVSTEFTFNLILLSLSLYLWSGSTNKQVAAQELVPAQA